MDPESLRALGRRFWYAWGTAMLVGAAAVVVGTAVVAPTDAWLVGLCGLLALVFVGFGVVSLTQGDHLDAAGMWVAAAGWVVWASAATASFPDGTFWGGWALIAVGGAVGLWADHGHRVRATVGS